MKDFGTILMSLRSERGYTQAQLAKKLNKSPTEISRYESNQRLPTLDTLISMSILFNVSINYLAGLETTKSYSTDGLEEHQLDLINTLILEFREKKRMTKLGLTKRQLTILNDLFIEFLHMD